MGPRKIQERLESLASEWPTSLILRSHFGSSNTIKPNIIIQFLMNKHLQTLKISQKLYSK